MMQKRSKWLAVFFVAVLIAAVATGCAATQSGTAEDSPTATVPDYSSVDFSGSWAVSKILTKKGSPVSSDVMQELGAGFTLEILAGGTYFVYDADGKILGQGAYSVSGDILTLTAGDGETNYQIVDADTLQCESDDQSVTVMTKQPEPSPQE